MELISWWHHSKEKQNNVKSRFSTKIGIFYFPKTTLGLIGLARKSPHRSEGVGTKAFGI